MAGDRLLGLLFGAAALALFALSLAVSLTLYQRPGPHETPRMVVIEPGLWDDAIGRRLADAGVVPHYKLFTVAARLSGSSRALRAGEYDIPARASVRDVLRQIVEGRVVLHQLTVPEGLSVREVAALLHGEAALTGRITAMPAEGSLLPETYSFARGETRDALIGKMQRDMADALAALWPERADGLPFVTVGDAVTLASIVERETGVESERGRVAAVYVNRLRRGMRLQADPTVVYAVSGGLSRMDRDLTTADLAVDSPYNTYRVAGLPPGPIANPGIASIAAVLNPMTTDELYFVATGDGGHWFSRTLAEHNRNVARYRAALKAQR